MIGPVKERKYMPLLLSELRMRHWYFPHPKTWSRDISARNVPTVQLLGQLGPLVAYFGLVLQNGLIFVCCQGFAIDFGIQAVGPTVATLFGGAVGHVQGHGRPLFAMLIDSSTQLIVFFWSPERMRSSGFLGRCFLARGG
jgi:hypothetical protein